MKKPSVVSFLTTLLLAAAFCTHGNEFAELVMDTDGNPVEVGEQYIIQTVKTENNIVGGDIVPARAYLPPFCPTRITANTSYTNQLGLPVILSHLTGLLEHYVNMSYPVQIEFIKSPSSTVCNQFWEVNHSSSSPIYIVLGPRPMHENSLFKIEKAGANTYKFTTSIGPVGILTEGGDTWHTIPLLGVTNDTSKTLLVKFRKVYDATAATTSTSRVEKLGLRMFPFY